MLAMNGKCSSRDTATIISLIWNTTVSQQTILKILNFSGSIAKEMNKKLDLKAVETALLDEVFQNSHPLLVFADAASGVISLEESPDRSGDSWEVFLGDLKKLGLNPETVATDGGKGLLQGVKEIFGSATLIRDLFHVLDKLSKATKTMENSCYRILAKSYDLEEKDDIDGAITAMIEFDEAASIFDLYEKQLRDFELSSHLAHPESDKGYINSEALLKILVSIQESLHLFREKFNKHRFIKAAWSYLKNGASEIIAYKKKIETLIEGAFGERFKDMVLEHLCPMIEYINQYLRAHDSLPKREFWGNKISDLRQSLRSYGVVDQEEIDKAINMVWAIGLKCCKSNSFVESVNSVIRSYLNTYKSIPSWFCSLFTFFRNHHTFARGKRAKKSPIELLYGEHQPDWIDKIVENFPFEKLRSSIPAIPGYINLEWDRINRRPKEDHQVVPLRAVG